MATSNDWINLGMAPQQAYRQNFTPTQATAYGTSVGSANKIGGAQYFTWCNTGTSSFALPQVHADTGALLGDYFIIANLSSANIQLYSPTSAAGSVVTLFGGAVSAVGTTGVAIPTGYMAMCLPFTSSSWTIGIASV